MAIQRDGPAKKTTPKVKKPSGYGTGYDPVTGRVTGYTPQGVVPQIVSPTTTRTTYPVLQITSPTIVGTSYASKTSGISPTFVPTTNLGVDQYNSPTAIKTTNVPTPPNPLAGTPRGAIGTGYDPVTGTVSGLPDVPPVYRISAANQPENQRYGPNQNEQPWADYGGVNATNSYGTGYDPVTGKVTGYSNPPVVPQWNSPTVSTAGFTPIIRSQGPTGDDLSSKKTPTTYPPLERAIPPDLGGGGGGGYGGDGGWGGYGSGYGEASNLLGLYNWRIGL